MPLSFTCVYIAIIAIILPMTLWRVVSAPVLKCYGCWFDSQLAVYTGGAGPVCEWVIIKFSVRNSSKAAISFSFIKFNLRITVLGLGLSLVCSDN